MTGDLVGMLRLHEIASRFGGGLRPELLRLMTLPMDAYGHRVIPLNAPMASSGPAHQQFSDGDLDRRAIPRLAAARRRTATARDGTHD